MRRHSCLCVCVAVIVCVCVFAKTTDISVAPDCVCPHAVQQPPQACSEIIGVYFLLYMEHAVSHLARHFAFQCIPTCSSLHPLPPRFYPYLPLHPLPLFFPILFSEYGNEPASNQRVSSMGRTPSAWRRAHPGCRFFGPGYGSSENWQ